MIITFLLLFISNANADITVHEHYVCEDILVKENGKNTIKQDCYYVSTPNDWRGDS